MLELPVPKIKRREVDESRYQAALQAGLDPAIAAILASRPFLPQHAPQDLISPKLKQLDNPAKLADIDKASTRLIQALENGEIIGIETDHDCDGQTSHAVIYTVLTQHFQHPKEKVQSYIGHRLKEGYGLSDSVVDRILAENPRPSLIITADNGSSDEARIKRLKEQGIDVIVTDHHEIPSEGIPKSAYAVLNPTREDCQYPDSCIAGCMVAWLLMAHTRGQLIQKKQKGIPSLAACLDFVAVGTIADCVSMARSLNNRIVVDYGMKLIAQGSRYCWQVLLPLLSTPISSEDLGFKIGPLLNSDGRLACAFGSVSFLLAENLEEAKLWVAHLQIQNQERKKIQDRVTELALKQAMQQYHQGKSSLCIFLEEGHAGVHGISASRIKDMFGRPVIVFCPKQENAEIITGSARSIDGLHLREVLESIHQQHPQLLDRFGGHKAAAGLSLSKENLTQFAELFEQGVRNQTVPQQLGPVVWTDGELPIASVNIETVEKIIHCLSPYGREFDMPCYELNGRVVSIQFLGQTKTHARLGLAIDDEWFEAVWFNCCRSGEAFPVQIGDEVAFVYAPATQIFRGVKQLSCKILHLRCICTSIEVENGSICGIINE